MKLLADECVDKQIVDYLRDVGCKVLYISEMKPGISDEKVLNIANKEMSILITADKDFGELVFRQKKINLGVIFLRLAGLSPEAKAEIVVTAIKNHKDEIQGNFTVIMLGAVRVRKRIF